MKRSLGTGSRGVLKDARSALSHLHGLLFLCALLAVFTACSEKNPAPLPSPTDKFEVINLVSELPFSEVIVESTGVDLGDPGSMKQLVEGWSEMEGGEEKWIWAVGSHSIISFVNVVVGDKVLELMCRPFVYPGMEPQKIRVQLNGHDVGEIKLASRFKSYAIHLPAHVLSRGENRIQFRYAHFAVPKDVTPDAADPRELAVSFKSIRIHPATAKKTRRNDETLPEAVSAEGNMIRQSPGTALDYYLELPPQATLVTAVYDSRETAGLIYNISLTEDGSDEEYLFANTHQTEGGLLERIGIKRTNPRWVDAEVPLTGDTGKIVRLRFEMLRGDGKGVSPGGSWYDPRIVTDEVSAGSAREPDRPDNQESLEYFESLKKDWKSVNIIIYLVDALRADHLGCYGYERETSPNIDRLAEDGIVFEKFISEGSWTRPSVASLMTGLHHRVHGVMDMEDALKDSVTLISEILHDRGYTTGIISLNAHMHEKFGFNKGFDEFLIWDIEELDTSSRIANDATFELLEKHRGEPVFLYIHTVDPHDPYQPEKEYRIFESDYDGTIDGSAKSLARLERLPRDKVPREHVEQVEALYDAEIRHNDEQFGKLIDKIKQLGLYDRSIIIFTADHGEEFFEHGGFKHGQTVYTESVHVPFILKLPDQRFSGTLIRDLAMTVDIVPTILDLVGISAEPEFDGKSLKPLISSTKPAHRVLFNEIDMKSKDFRAEALYRGKWKLNVPLSPKNTARLEAGGPLELFDIEKDWAETKNLYSEYPIIAKYLYHVLEKEKAGITAKAALFGDVEKISREEIPPDVIKQMKALGYID